MSKKDMMRGRRAPTHTSTKLYMVATATIVVGMAVGLFANFVAGFLLLALGGGVTWIGIVYDGKGQ